MDKPPDAPEARPAAPPPADTPSDAMGERLLQQAFELWIEPEIQRRREAGTWQEGPGLHAAQIIFNADADQPEVRLNHEVRVIVQGREARPVEKGEIAHADDFSEYTDLALANEDGNAGHLTLLRRPDHWWIAFDFHYNAERIDQTIKAAQEFLEAATSALKQGHSRAFIDTLHSSVELAAKALLLTVPDKQVITSRTHGFIGSRSNLWRKQGAVPAQFVELLNTLTALRPSARYLQKELSLQPAEAEKMLAIAHEMHAFVRERSPKRPTVPSPSEVMKRRGEPKKP